MTGELAASADIDVAIIRHQMGSGINVHFQVLADVLGGDVRYVFRAHRAVALNESYNGVLLRDRLALVDVLGLAADIGLIALDNLVKAADWASLGVAHSRSL